jgi:hypothetical protein
VLWDLLWAGIVAARLRCWSDVTHVKVSGLESERESQQSLYPTAPHILHFNPIIPSYDFYLPGLPTSVALEVALGEPHPLLLLLLPRHPVTLCLCRT